MGVLLTIKKKRDISGFLEIFMEAYCLGVYFCSVTVAEPPVGFDCGSGREWGGLKNLLKSQENI
jgi:hypothetical protein